MITEFDKTLQDGIDDILRVDGEDALWYPPGTAVAGVPVKVAHLMETIVKETGDSASLYNHRVNVSNDQIDPENAQGGILVFGSKTWFVVEVQTHTVKATTLTLSESPIHGAQARMTPTPSTSTSSSSLAGMYYRPKGQRR